jgi:hypothetical protein
VKDDPRRSPPAAAIENDALFAAKAALKRAGAIRRDANAQFDLCVQLVERLERKDATAQ